MPTSLSPGEKAARTRKRRAAALIAVTTRKHRVAFGKAHKAEAESKRALRRYCKEHKWSVAFFEGKTGAPRTGIIDAVMFRISKQNADVLDLLLVQLKGGSAGASGAEIARLKKATEAVEVDWLIAAFDGEVLHLVAEAEEVSGKAKVNPARRGAAIKAGETRRRRKIDAIEAKLMQPIINAEPL